MSAQSAQLNRMEDLLNVILQRVSAIERNQTGTGITAPAPAAPSSNAPMPIDRSAQPPAGFKSPSERHPQLPQDRNPKPDCGVCIGTGLVQCRTCRGKGGQTRCDDCNGSGRDKKIGTYQRCTWCNGTGWKDCLCIGGVEGKEFCECTMTEEERNKMKEMENAVNGMVMGGLNLGIGGMNMSAGLMNSMGDMFKM